MKNLKLTNSKLDGVVTSDVFCNRVVSFKLSQLRFHCITYFEMIVLMEFLGFPKNLKKFTRQPENMFI